MPTHTQPKPQPPTTFLPALGCLATFSSSQLTKTLQNIRDLYFPQVPSLAGPTGFFPQNASHLHPNRLVQHDVDVPDSGYASAEEGEDDQEVDQVAPRVSEDEIDVLRSDPLERAYAIKWLTSFIAHFVTLSHSEDLIDIASALLSSLSAPAACSQEGASLTRTFTFPHPNKGEIKVQLNDAPLLSTDHTSVGLQSWASSVVLADRLSSNPPAFGLVTGRNLRVLELGAGTGLLSIVISLLIPSAKIIATDFHPSVLSNLRTNVRSNSSESLTAVEVRHLDWSDPNYTGQPFDIVVAADVIYEKEHAGWIRNCVERLLVKPSSPPLSDNGGDSDRGKGGTFWLIIPVRTTGRHEKMGGSVEVVFPDACDVRRRSSSSLAAGGVTHDMMNRWTLAIIHREDIERQGRIGRADEGGYRLFGIGWVSSR